MVLRWYVLREHLGPFLLSFAVIMFLLVVDLILQVVDLILKVADTTGVVLELFFLNMAWMVALAVPMAVLVATLMAFGRLSGDREITAMHALGIGLHQVIWPVLLVGAAIGGLLILFNDCVLPDFNHRARLLTWDIRHKSPTVALDGRTGTFIQDFENYRILIGTIDQHTSRLQDLVIYRYEAGGYPTTILAESGEVAFSEQTDAAYLTLYGGEIHRVDEEDPEVYVRSWPEKLTLYLGEAGRTLTRTVSQYRTDREMTVWMMLERVRKYEGEARVLEAEAAAKIVDTFQRHLVRNPTEGGVYGFRDLRELQSRVQTDAIFARHKRRSADRYRVEIHKKFSIPVACLVFILVGAPLGVRVRLSGPAVGAGISIGFFLVYWLFLIGGEKLADRGFIPPWFAMWSPNITIGLVGGWMTLRMVCEQGVRPLRRKKCAS